MEIQKQKGKGREGEQFIDIAGNQKVRWLYLGRNSFHQHPFNSFLMKGNAKLHILPSRHLYTATEISVFALEAMDKVL